VSTSGSLTQSGPITPSGAATIAVGPTNDATLTDPGNNFTSLGIDSARDVSVADADSLNFNDVAVTRDLTATAGASITDSGAVAVGRIATLDPTTSVALDSAGNDFSTVVVPSATGVSIGDANDLVLGQITSSGGLRANAGGALTQSGAASIAGSTVAVGAPVTLDQTANDFNNTVAITSTGGSDAAVLDANDLRLADSTSGGALTARAADDLTVDPAQTIAATGALRLVADNQSPAAPGIGTGGLTIGAGSALTGAGAIQLYGAHRADNTVNPSATFNGATFTPGTLFAPSATERWGVYAPGGTATAPFTFFYKDNDTVNPTVALRAPADGAAFTVGDVVAADYSCADDAAVASCAGTVANGAPIDTSSAGTKSFTVEATDAAGNKATTTVSYVVNAAPAVIPPVVTPPVVTRPKASLHAVVSGTRTAKLRRGHKPRLVTSLIVSCPAGLPRSCGGSGQVTANVPKQLAARTVVIGKLGFAVPPGKSRRVVINLTPRGRRIIEQVKRVRITLRVTTRGLDGKRVVTARTLTLKLH
jgi:hypothetical protein